MKKIFEKKEEKKLKKFNMFFFQLTTFDKRGTGINLVRVLEISINFFFQKFIKSKIFINILKIQRFYVFRLKQNQWLIKWPA